MVPPPIRIGRLLPGSVAEKVVRRAACAVLTVSAARPRAEPVELLPVGKAAEGVGGGMPEPGNEVTVPGRRARHRPHPRQDGRAAGLPQD